MGRYYASPSDPSCIQSRPRAEQVDRRTKFMNRDGNRENLRASQPANTNAEKSGVYSERRRAEKTRDVLEAMAKDPDWLHHEVLAELAESVALSELCAKDIAQRGVTDRKGDVRRIVGTHMRALKMRQELSDRIQAQIAASEAEERHAEPFNRAEGLRLLRDIAHSHSTGPGASVSAIKYLLESPEGALTPEQEYWLHFAEEWDAMSPEEQDRELMAWNIPVTTDPANPTEVSESEMIMRHLALRSRFEEDDLRALQRVLEKEFGPLTTTEPPPSAGATAARAPSAHERQPQRPG